MSFILDALKKLERQKQSGESSRQTVMEGGRRWGEDRKRFAFGWGSVVVALAAFIVAAVALFQSFRVQTPESSPVEPAPAAAELSSVEASLVANREESVEAPGKASPDSLMTVAPLIPSTKEEDSVGDSEPPESLPAVEASPETAPPVRLVGRNVTESPRATEQRDDTVSYELPQDLPELVLQGTSIIDGEPVAVVNYLRLFEGDFIEGARVVRILDSEVELEYKGKRFRIKF